MRNLLFLYLSLFLFIFYLSIFSFEIAKDHERNRFIACADISDSIACVFGLTLVICKVFNVAGVCNQAFFLHKIAGFRNDILSVGFITSFPWNYLYYT